MFKLCCLLLLSPAVCLAAPQQSQLLGFGDASPDEIAQIRAGTYGETFDENPQYSFNYKVADDTEQTYMAMNENRDGDQVTGSYQYVDPLGNLIIVTYTAGAMGYSETREVREGFVQIRERPSSSSSSSGSSFSGSGSSFNGGSSSSGFSSSGFGSSSGSSFSDSGFFSGSSNNNNGFSSSSSSSLNTNDIVSTVVSQVQPLISSTVSNAVSGANRRPSSVLATPPPPPPPLPLAPAAPPAPLFSSNDIVSQVVSEISPLVSSTVSNAVSGGSSRGSSFSTSSNVRPISRAPAPAPVRPASPVAAGSSITDLFGTGGTYNVRFNTPEFNIEY